MCDLLCNTHTTTALKSGSLDSEQAWRIAFIIPSSLVLCCAVAVYTLADDSPKGNFKELISQGT
jgi:sugar phosphate permease